ncbi:hypothetical protein [Polynucleobacter sp. MWH-Aus1W21]|uniref:hypothetical protein n=1 Tax=Polynucleobacter sp. MWH-Aus1W21 TaxID=1855880 RepID=UPI001BFECF63|nr:hypothetical protein [Polynucleobacter sp. MWH-Aus1W21]
MAVFLLESAGPNKGWLLSVTVGKTTSMQMGLKSMTLKKLHSFLVAAEATCSKGDLPVAAVEARLAAVLGFATAAVPAALAAVVLPLLSTARGAAQALNNPSVKMKPNQREITRPQRF